MQHFDSDRNIGDDNIGVQHDDGAPDVAVSARDDHFDGDARAVEAVENTVETQIAVESAPY